MTPLKWDLINAMKPHDLPEEVQRRFQEYLVARLDFEMALENFDAVLEQHYGDRPRLIDKMITAANAKRLH